LFLEGSFDGTTDDVLEGRFLRLLGDLPGVYRTLKAKDDDSDVTDQRVRTHEHVSRDVVEPLLKKGLRRSGASPTGARQLEDDGYVLPRPRVAFVVTPVDAEPERNAGESRPATTVAARDAAIDDSDSEGAP
jgi:hypothetical protein